MTRDNMLMLSTALTQFIENANDPEEQSAAEQHQISLAQAMLDQIDAEFEKISDIAT